MDMDISMDIHAKICGYGWEISYPRQAWCNTWCNTEVYTGLLVLTQV